MGKALFDKIWDGHVIADLGNGFILMHIDRLLLHDMSGGKSLKEAIEKGYAPAQPRHRHRFGHSHEASTTLMPTNHDLDAAAIKRIEQGKITFTRNTIDPGNAMSFQA